MPRGLVVLGAGAEINPDQVQAELVQAVREQIGAVAALRTVHVVPGLPKTRSGKMLRKRYMASPTAETNPTLACGPVVAAFTEGCAAVRLGRSRRMPPARRMFTTSGGSSAPNRHSPGTAKQHNRTAGRADHDRAEPITAMCSVFLTLIMFRRPAPTTHSRRSVHAKRFLLRNTDSYH
ncbi:AMP-binding enzyme [Nocardia abscessus]|uniref:AMP-binding enzyme n=1 Tax=Nocardia abscessus TaxID=120957 RepID=UPI003CC7DBC2